MSSYKCPFCNEVCVDNEDTHRQHMICFNFTRSHGAICNIPFTNDRFDMDFFLCPSCQKYAVKVIGKNAGQFEGIEKWLAPAARVPHIAADLPASVYQDYEEACAILNDSPKASATMSRRCLQGMIRDFWDIRKNNLHQEITALKGRVDDEFVETLLAFKSIANIGAHPEKGECAEIILDVAPGEAEALLEVIEYLADDWYVAKKKKTGLFAHLREMGKNKAELKNNQSAGEDKS